jgi:hypothetical protein
MSMKCPKRSPFSKQTPVALWQRCERRVAGALKPVCFFSVVVPCFAHQYRLGLGVRY